MESLGAEIPSVTRTLALLEALAGDKEGHSLSELHQRVKVPISVVSKILTTLHARGYVVRDPDSKRYRLGFRLVSLAQRHVDALELEDYYLPILQSLARKTGELVQLAVVMNSESMAWVAKVDGVRPLRIASLVGHEVVLHATAVGKAWLASLDPTEAVEKALRRGPLRRYTPRTLCTVPELLLDLETIRTRGYSVANEELILGAAGVAAPVVVDKGVEAGVSVAFPIARATAELCEEIARETIEAAREIAQVWPDNWRYVRPSVEPIRPLSNEYGR